MMMMMVMMMTMMMVMMSACELLGTHLNVKANMRRKTGALDLHCDQKMKQTHLEKNQYTSDLDLKGGANGVRDSEVCPPKLEGHLMWMEIGRGWGWGWGWGLDHGVECEGDKSKGEVGEADIERSGDSGGDH